MNKPTILVVEDDTPVRNLITTTLKAHGYPFLTAQNGESAILAATSHKPDVIFLDLGLPDMDGVEVIRRVRSWSEMPIIVISARSEDSDKISALDAGADDYLTKPFSVEELLARLRVTQRRLASLENKAAEESCFQNGGLRIDYKLLCLLARNMGKVLTHSYLTEKIWGTSWDSDFASLRVHMATLRKKLQPSPDSPQFIQTHIGIGYRMLKVE